MTRPAPAYFPPPDSGLDIRYVDADLLVVDKPSGLLSVPGRGAGMDDNLASRVQARYPEALTVHRLDMDTSGLLVMARNAQLHLPLLLRQFERNDFVLEASCRVRGAFCKPVAPSQAVMPLTASPRQAAAIAQQTVESRRATPPCQYVDIGAQARTDATRDVSPRLATAMVDKCFCLVSGR